MKRNAALAGWRSKHQEVEYYAQDVAAQRNIKDPTESAFFKPAVFAEQCEYRLAVWHPRFLKFEQRIVVGDALEKVERERKEEASEFELRLPGKAAAREYMRVHYKQA